MLCNVNDHEIFENIMAYQAANNAASPQTSTGKLMIGRLRAIPQGGGPSFTKDQVFLWGPLEANSGGTLPPLGATSNGPEIGFDNDEGYEVVYTMQDANLKWRIARAACQPPAQTPCFAHVDYDNVSPYQNRWAPFVTQNSELDEPAKVVYNATQFDPLAQDKLKVFRVLEGSDPHHPPSGNHHRRYGAGRAYRGALGAHRRQGLHHQHAGIAG